MSLQLKKMNEICEITSSKRIYAKEYQSEGVPFFRGKEIVEKFNGALSVSTELFISENKFEEIKRKFGAPQKNDILLTSVGTIGVPYHVDGRFDFYFKDGNLTWFRNINGVNSKFLYYWLISSAGKAQLSKCTIGAAQPAYTIVRLKEMEILLPSLTSQQKIVSILDSYNSLIENNKRRIALLEESARLLYREWFVHFRFPGHEHVKIIDGLPEGWKIALLSDVANVNDKSLKNGFDGRIEYIDIASVGTGIINDTTWYDFEDAPGRARRIVRHLDIIWSCVRPNRKSYAFMWEPHERLICSTGFAVITPATVKSGYLYHFLTTDSFVSYLTNNAGGAAYPAVTAKVFEKAEVAVPPLSLQNQFEDIFLKLKSQINNLDKQNQKLTQARDILLPRLMNGDLAV